MNIYVELTKQFNHNRLRAILAGGQAVVLHRLAIMSKDGDWIVREDEEALGHILSVLDQFGAQYRFGAPLDLRWMPGGWSSHLEFIKDDVHIRTDFVTRPPRLDSSVVASLWQTPEAQENAVLGPRELVETKKTNREKDYAVIGELARIMSSDEDRILCSRSARELLEYHRHQPDLFAALAQQRPVLGAADQGLEQLETALDAERRALMHANERRLAAYMTAAEDWATLWPEVNREIASKPLPEAHRILCQRAEGVLPFEVQEESNNASG